MYGYSFISMELSIIEVMMSTLHTIIGECFQCQSLLITTSSVCTPVRILLANTLQLSVAALFEVCEFVNVNSELYVIQINRTMYC